jgi:hypothetical protein
LLPCYKKGKGKGSSKRNLLPPCYKNENGEDFSKRNLLLPCNKNENGKHSSARGSCCHLATRKGKMAKITFKMLRNFLSFLETVAFPTILIEDTVQKPV